MLNLLLAEQERNESTHTAVKAVVNGEKTDIKIEYYTLYASRLRKGGYVINSQLPNIGEVSVRERASFFHTLFELRKKLEIYDIHLCVWGGKKTVWPTGMESDMGGGFAALDRASDSYESRFILDNVEFTEIATTSRQYEHIQTMIKQGVK